MTGSESSIHSGSNEQVGRRLDLSIIKDLPYANQSEAQKLDIYMPFHNAGSRPVILLIHPGGFHTGDKGGDCEIPLARVNMIELVRPMIERGYSVVSINYRLSQEAIFPALIFDIKAAVRWIRANAAQYGFRKDKIAAWALPPAAISRRCWLQREASANWRTSRWATPTSRATLWRRSSGTGR